MPLRLKVLLTGGHQVNSDCYVRVRPPPLFNHAECRVCGSAGRVSLTSPCHECGVKWLNISTAREDLVRVSNIQIHRTFSRIETVPSTAPQCSEQCIQCVVAQERIYTIAWHGRNRRVRILMSLTAYIYAATTPIPGENSARLRGVVSVRPLAIPCWFSQELALRKPRRGAQEYQTENNVRKGGGGRCRETTHGCPRWW